MRFLARLCAVIGILFVAFLALGAFLHHTGHKPNDPAAAARQDICTRMWQDAKPGWEKRTAREMCDTFGVKP